MSATRSPFVVGGAVPHDSPTYVIRAEIEIDIANALQIPTYVSIVGPRQIGKTSLLHKIATSVRREYGQAAAVIDMSVFNDPQIDWQTWSRLVCERLHQALGEHLEGELPRPPSTGAGFITYWHDLAACLTPPRALILLDEASALPNHLRDSFYSILRSLFNERQAGQSGDALRKLNFVFAGVFDPDRLIKDRFNSPFNVSQVFRLGDFNRQEVDQLTNLLPHKLSRSAAAAFYQEVEGHPFLSQWLAELVWRAADSKLVRSAKEIRALARELPRVAANNLDPMTALAVEDRSGRSYLKRILAGETIPFSRANPVLSQLERCGAIKEGEDGTSRIRNPVYAELLTRALDSIEGSESPSPFHPPASSTTGRATRVFISYSHRDVKFVRRLRSDIRAATPNVWVDEQELKVGDSISESISNGLAGSDYLVVVLSKNSIKSRWVRLELASALSEELSGRGIVVLPAQIEDCKVPILLRDKLSADFRSDYHRGLQQLLDVLEDESTMARAIVPRAETADPCRERLESMPLAEIRRLISHRLSFPDLSALWFDTLGEALDRSVKDGEHLDAVVQLLHRAKQRRRMGELIENLCAGWGQELDR